MLPHNCCVVEQAGQRWQTKTTRRRVGIVLPVKMIQNASSTCCCCCCCYRCPPLIADDLIPEELAFGDSSLVTVVTNRTCNRKNTCKGAIAQEGCPRMRQHQTTKSEQPRGKARGQKRPSEVLAGRLCWAAGYHIVHLL